MTAKEFLNKDESGVYSEQDITQAMIKFADEQLKNNVQKLIDKDIFDQATLAMEEIYGSGCNEEIDAYFRGAKWMQERMYIVKKI